MNVSLMLAHEHQTHIDHGAALERLTRRPGAGLKETRAEIGP